MQIVQGVTLKNKEKMHRVQGVALENMNKDTQGVTLENKERCTQYRSPLDTGSLSRVTR